MALEEKNAANNTKLQANKNLFSTNLNTWMNKNTSAAKVFAERLADIKSKLASADATEFTHLENEFKAIQAEATQMGLTGSNAVKAMKSEFDRAVTSVVSLTAAFQTSNEWSALRKNWMIPYLTCKLQPERLERKPKVCWIPTIRWQKN